METRLPGSTWQIFQIGFQAAAFHVNLTQEIKYICYQQQLHNLFNILQFATHSPVNQHSQSVTETRNNKPGYRADTDYFVIHSQFFFLFWLP